MDEQTEADIRAYVKARDEALMSDDPAVWRAFWEGAPELAGDRDGHPPISDEGLRLAVLRARTGAMTLPASVRLHAHLKLALNGKKHLSLYGANGG